MTFDENTTGRDLMALLSEDEQSCVRDRLGGETVDALLEQPVLSIDPTTEFPLDCIAEETAAEISIAFLDQEAGGLTPESRTCVRDLYATAGVDILNPDAMDSPASLAFGIEFLSCLTDEEAVSIGMAEESPFTPSQIRCVKEQLGEEGFAAFFAAFAMAEEDPTKLFQALAQAAPAFEACGVELMTPGPGLQP